MLIKSAISHFCKSEEGAVTVDFVVLTAAIVGLGVAATAVVSSGVSDLSTDVDGQLNAQVIQTSFGPSISGITAFVYEGLVYNEATIAYYIDFYTNNNSDGQVQT